MIKSMTAYASREKDLDIGTISCELRSVNHRYSDITLKIPDTLRFLEASVRTMIAEKISRGKVDCTLTYKLPKKQLNLSVDLDAVTALLTEINKIEAMMPNSSSLSALDILAFPGIQQENTLLNKDRLQSGFSELIKQTLSEFLAVREREGTQLSTVIVEKCEKMQLFTQAASERIPEVMLLIRNKLNNRIIELVAQPDFDRLEQELVLLAQKIDISEELDRLETHIAEVLRILTQPEPAGRRLDFLMQELNREANTLGSKSTDKRMTQIAIELKVLIEQVREQVQNIE